MVFDSSVPEDERQPHQSLPKEAPSVEIAKARAMEKRPLNDNGKPPSLLTPISLLLKSMGRAPVLYLNFIQMVSVYALLTALLHTPYLVFYVMGRSDDSDSSNIFYLTSIASWDSTNIWYSVTMGICELLMALLSIATIRFLLWHSKRLNKLSESVVSIRHFAVHVRRVPPEEVTYGTKRLEKFFSAFGPVHRVVMFLNSGDLSKLKNDLEQYESMLRRARARLHDGYRVLKLYYVLKIRYVKLMRMLRRNELEYHLNKKAYKCTGDALVVFRTERARYKALHTFNKPLVQSCFGLLIPRFVRRIRFRVFKGLAPNNIRWENFEYSFLSKVFRRSVAVLLTISSMIVGIVLAYILEIIKSAYFTANLIDVGKIGTLRDVVTFLGSMSISFANYLIVQVLCFILFYVSGFEKHRLDTHTKQSLMYKLVFSQVFVSGAVLFVYTLANQQTKHLLPSLRFELRNVFFTTLFTTIGFSVVSNVLKEFFLAPWHAIKRRIRVNQSKSQEELDEAFIPPQYSIEYRYSFQLKSIILAVAFSGAWPPALWMLFIGLVCTYVVDKVNLMRLYRKFYQAKDLLCKSAIKCLAFGILARFAIQLIFCALLFQRTQGDIVPLVLSNVYAIGVLVAAIVFTIYLLLQFVMPDLNLWQLCCFSMYRFPKYATGLRGRDSIDNYKVEMYEPPILPKDVKFRYYREELEQTRHSVPTGTAVELFT